MERDKIVEQLNQVNRKLNQGDKCNPAYIKDGNLVFYGTPEEMKEVVDLIGEWSYKKESKTKSDLELQKTMLEEELRATF